MHTHHKTIWPLRLDPQAWRVSPCRPSFPTPWALGRPCTDRFSRAREGSTCGQSLIGLDFPDVSLATCKVSLLLCPTQIGAQPRDLELELFQSLLGLSTHQRLLCTGLCTLPLLHSRSHDSYGSVHTPTRQSVSRRCKGNPKIVESSVLNFTTPSRTLC